MVLTMVRMESGVMGVVEGVWFGMDGVEGRETDSTFSKNCRSCHEMTSLHPPDSWQRRS